MKSRFLLSSFNRLCKKNHFDRFFSSSRRIDTDLFSFYYAEPQLDEPSVAFVASKKTGNAVVRNRCKRMLREVLRLNQSIVNKTFDYVLVSKRAMKDVSSVEVSEQLLRSLSVMEQRIARRQSS